jgi:uncharacterized protein (DUF433 family)
MLDWRQYIESKPSVMLGKPVFVGTRLTVEHVLREQAQGVSEEQLLAAYPQLTLAHLRAAMLFAAELCDLETTVAL